MRAERTASSTRAKESAAPPEPPEPPPSSHVCPNGWHNANTCSRSMWAACCMSAADTGWRPLFPPPPGANELAIATARRSSTERQRPTSLWSRQLPCHVFTPPPLLLLQVMGTAAMALSLRRTVPGARGARNSCGESETVANRGLMRTPLPRDRLMFATLNWACSKNGDRCGAVVLSKPADSPNMSISSCAAILFCDQRRKITRKFSLRGSIEFKNAFNKQTPASEMKLLSLSDGTHSEARLDCCSVHECFRASAAPTTRESFVLAKHDAKNNERVPILLVA
jgi:hypothetical protein